jgi:hypothetical protein
VHDDGYNFVRLQIVDAPQTTTNKQLFLLDARQTSNLNSRLQSIITGMMDTGTDTHRIQLTMGTPMIGKPTIETPSMVVMDKSYIEMMGEEFMTSEVTEDTGMVSGIEIAPSKRSCLESVSTDSTDPLTTGSGSSGSWSVSSNSLVDARTDTSDDSEEDENDQAPDTGTPLFCNAGGSMGNFVDADGFFSPVYRRRRKGKPKKKRATISLAAKRPCDVQEERTRVEMVLVMKPDSLSERGKKNVSVVPEELGIVNTVENEPDRLFSSLISKTTSLLCSMSLKATNLPFLLNSVTHSASNGFSLQPPFVMFPNKSTVFVAKHKDSDVYQLMSRGPIPVDSLSQLFAIQERMEGLFVSILAFHDGIPALVGNDPLALNGNHFNILLDDWRRKRKTKIGTNTETDKVALKPKRKMQIDVDDECGNFVCNPGLLPLMTSPVTTNDETSLLCDEELRAVMRITQNGNDTSALFPCFSTGSDSCYSNESDDGLRDELGALESLQKELQVELQTAEATIDEIDEIDIGMGKFKLPSARSNGTDDINIGKGSKPIRKLPSARRREEYSIPLSPPIPHPPRSRRRVRFSKTNTEHIFISETISDESAEDYGCEFHMDEYSLAFEDVFEELKEGFLQNLHYFRPRQPKDRVATRSNMHYF